jgi:hypothetical protein
MYTKQPEAVAAYKKFGLPYPEEVADWLHEGKFLSQTAKSPEPANFCTITSLLRIKTPLEGKEYLVYSLLWHRTDALGNIRHSFVSGFGKGPKLQLVRSIRKDENGYEEQYISRANIVGTEYYIPYTGPESVQKLIKKLEKQHGAALRLNTEEDRKKWAADQERREKWAEEHGKVIHNAEKEGTGLMVQRDGNRIKYLVYDYESFLNGDFEDLVMFSKIPTDKERIDRLAAQEVANAQSSLASVDANIAAELERAKDRIAKGVPYK